MNDGYGAGQVDMARQMRDTRNAVTMPAEARQAEVTAQMSNLEAAVVAASQAFAQLADRMTPVLRNEDTNECSDKLPVSSLCPLAEHIRALTTHVSQLGAHISRASRRLEL